MINEDSSIDEAIGDPTTERAELAWLQGVGYEVRLVQNFQRETVTVRTYPYGNTNVIPFSDAVFSYKHTEFAVIYRAALNLATEMVLADK